MAFDISSTTPAAPSGRTLVTWLSDGSANISGSVPAAEPAVLTTKGDVLGYDTAPDRVPVGSDGQVLTADSAQALGVKWATPGSGSLTTKGDILGYDTSPDRVPVGANDTFLRADSTQALGIRYGALVAADVPAISLTSGVSGVLPIANGGTGSSAFPTTIGIGVVAGATGTAVAPRRVASHAGVINRCTVMIDAADATVDLTFTIKQNGTAIFTSSQTVTHGTAVGTLVTITALTSTPLSVAQHDVFTLDISSGSTSWSFTAQLES